MNILKTDLHYVRTMTKSLLSAIDIKCNNIQGCINHPFANNIYIVDERRQLLDITKEHDYKKWIKWMSEIIDNSDMDKIFNVLICEQWRLTLFLFLAPQLEINDFSRLLSNAFVGIEWRDADPKIPTSMLIKWFKKADKEIIMNDDEYQCWKSLPDEVELYKGSGPKRGGKSEVSWTLNIDIAKSYRQRFATENIPGCLYSVIAPKECCLCYFNRQGENEIVVDMSAIKNLIEVVCETN